MSDVVSKVAVRRKRSIQRVHYDIGRAEMTARPLGRREPGVTAYHQQVAGHRDTEDTKYLGLLQCSNGTILKPIIKEAQRREVDFYTRVASSTDPDLVELRKLVPKFFGTTRYCYAGHTQEYIMLEDLVLRMMEPCIMDVKIGRRTWDPLATEEKIKKEQSKYALCKQQYAFCIPGYQVFRVPGGRRIRYGKDHGKKLHGQAVKDAILNYLNAGGRGPCRALVLQLLGALWRLQTWARRQSALRLYSASLLLLHDAARARACCQGPQPCAERAPAPCSGPRHTLAAAPVSPVTTQVFSHPPQSNNEVWERLNHNHSFEHNYEDELTKIKLDYRATLDELSNDSPPNPWATVKIIDFAHAFFNEEDERALDDNFREGIENLVEIFEGFLSETNDHVV